jgi:hypothetical protein
VKMRHWCPSKGLYEFISLHGVRFRNIYIFGNTRISLCHDIVLERRKGMRHSDGHGNQPTARDLIASPPYESGLLCIYTSLLPCDGEWRTDTWPRIDLCEILYSCKKNLTWFPLLKNLIKNKTFGNQLGFSVSNTKKRGMDMKRAYLIRNR